MIRKIIITQFKKYDNLLEHIAKNNECEIKLKTVSGVDNFNEMHVNHFMSVKVDLLQLFAMVRLVEDPWT